jgi:predicted O-methyltransferase YrrM
MNAKSMMESLRLAVFSRIERKKNPLGTLTDSELKNILSSKGDLWTEEKPFLDWARLPEMTHGVNPGDQRAIYQLVIGLRPRTILEIGTHIGCSTTAIALAMKRMTQLSDIDSRFWTVDIRDVNDKEAKPWLRYNSVHSPREIVEHIPEIRESISFVTMSAVDFLNRTNLEFDLAFLDSSGAVSQVYREICRVLWHLREGGFILLHGYFPKLKPLWSDGKVISGPFVAVQRLIKEGLQLTELPLGSLPWPTKLGSNVTSLCLLTKKP